MQQRLERERRRELQLLGLAPGGADELARLLGARAAARASRPRAAPSSPVDVHGGRLGAGGDDDEVAVPPLELLEHREQLVALGAALGPPHALLGLPAGQLERRSTVSSAASFASAPRSAMPASSASAPSPASNSGSA